MRLIFLAFAYLLKWVFSCYATYLAIICSLLLLVIGRQRYYLKRNMLYDAHSIVLSRIRFFGRRVIKSKIIREHDVPKKIVGYIVGLLVGITIRLQYPRFWALSRMYPEVELFWYITLILMLSSLSGFFSAEIYDWSAKKKKTELRKKII